MFNTEKKTVEIYGIVQYPVIPGERAFIYETGVIGVRATSVIQSVELLSADIIVIETMNTRYRIHTSPAETVVSEKPSIRTKLFGKS